MSATNAFKSQAGKNEVLRFYDLFLEKLTVSYDRLSVNTRLGNTFVIAAGKVEAPPLVLLHGSSMNSAMWIGDIKNYCNSFRVYALDIPGEPGRSDERQYPFNTSDYADWLIDTFNALRIDKAVVIGASLGAWLAAKFAVSNIGRVSALGLLCPAGIGSQNEDFKNIAFPLLSKGENGIKELFEKINGDNPIPEFLLNFQKLVAINFNARQEPIPMFSDKELKSLTMPVIVFVGEKDIILNSHETIQRCKEFIPNAHIVVFPEKGHSLAGVSNEITAFLTSSNI